MREKLTSFGFAFANWSFLFRFLVCSKARARTPYMPHCSSNAISDHPRVIGVFQAKSSCLFCFPSVFNACLFLLHLSSFIRRFFRRFFRRFKMHPSIINITHIHVHSRTRDRRFLSTDNFNMSPIEPFYSSTVWGRRVELYFPSAAAAAFESP